MSDQSEQNPFRSRRFVLALVVVGVIAICAVFVLISNLVGGKNDAAPTTSPRPTTSALATTSDPDPSTCGLKGYEPEGTVDSAPATEWELVGTVAAPTDPSSVGPGVVEENSFRSCFAHTPTGALYAAVNVVALASDRSLTTDLANKLVIPGAGQQALLDQAGDASTLTTRYQVGGFKIDAYAETTATIDLAVNFSTGEILSFPIQLQWVDGDWKVKTADDGGFTLAPASLQNLGGYVPWAGA